jgi:3-oxoacyl-[acyl-carrier-protein] synthase-3
MPAIIKGLGSYLPTLRITNQDFISHRFYKDIDQPFDDSNEIIIEKFKEITGIQERRYAQKDQTNSDLGILAAQRAIAAAGIDVETIDYIIFAHNTRSKFGRMKICNFCEIIKIPN